MPSTYSYIQTWPSDVKKLKVDCRTHFWKSEYLIALLRIGFRQKLFRLKVYFKPSRKNLDFFIFTITLRACLAKNSPLKWIPLNFAEKKTQASC